MNSPCESGLFLFSSVELLRLAGAGADLEMPDPTSRLRLVRPARRSAPEALIGSAPDCLGDTSVPGDRAHPGSISWPLGSERVRTPLVRLRRTCALRPILTRRRRRF